MTGYVSGMTRPEPSSQSAARAVERAKEDLAQAEAEYRSALYRDREAGWSQTELAKVLGISKQRVGQLTPGAPEQKRGRPRKTTKENDR
jgi:DNA-directed RNA polymerase specialized sigma24 family protein